MSSSTSLFIPEREVHCSGLGSMIFGDTGVVPQLAPVFFLLFEGCEARSDDLAILSLIELVRLKAVDSVCAGSRQPWYGYFSIVSTAVFPRHRPVLVLDER